MATDMQRLVVSLEAKANQFDRTMAKANADANRRASAIEKRFRDMNRSVTASLSNVLKGGAALGVGGFGVGEIVKYADAWTEAGNKIRAAATSAGVETRSLAELKDGANEARVGLEDYVDLYARLIRSASGVAKSELEIAAATSIVSKAFKAGGASASEQASGILQLGQALGSGVLQGDELRSLRENAPILAQAIAAEFKTTIAGLKELGAEGKLTSDRVFKAILKAQSGIEAQFGQTNATISDSYTRLRNNLTQYIGTQSEANGVASVAATVLNGLADNIGTVANAAAAAGALLLAHFGRGAAIMAVGALANPFVALAAAIGGAVFALSEFGDEVRPILGELATLQDYASVIWTGVATGVTDAATAVSAAFDSIVATISDALGGAEMNFADLATFAVDTTDNIIDAFKRVYTVLAAVFTELPAAVAEGAIGAMQAMVDIVESAINKVISGANKAIEAINFIASAGSSGIKPFAEIDLGDFENTYKGAGAAAGAAFGSAFKDSTSTPIRDAVNAARQAANERATTRTINSQVPFNPLSDPNAPKAKSGYGKGSGAAADGSGKKKKQNEFQREVEQIRERTALLEAEAAAQAKVNPLMDDFGFAVEKASKTQELLNAAKQAGITVTPKLEAQIDRLATSYASASAAADGLKQAQDDIKKAAEDQKEAYKELGDIAADAGNSLANALSDGKLEAQELIPIIMQLIQQLLAMKALGAIMGNLFSGATGGSINYFKPGLYADGGYTGAGGKHQPAGIVHKGEVVWSQDDVKRHGGARMVDSMRRGYADGGIVGGGRAPGAPKLPGPLQSIMAPMTFAPVVQGSGNAASDDRLLQQLRKMFDQEFTPRTRKALREIKFKSGGRA